jgi:hypothetical protein
LDRGCTRRKHSSRLCVPGLAPATKNHEKVKNGRRRPTATRTTRILPAGSLHRPRQKGLNRTSSTSRPSPSARHTAAKVRPSSQRVAALYSSSGPTTVECFPKPNTQRSTSSKLFNRSFTRSRPDPSSAVSSAFSGFGLKAKKLVKRGVYCQETQPISKICASRRLCMANS